jgi:hypothetical protein
MLDLQHGFSSSSSSGTKRKFCDVPSSTAKARSSAKLVSPNEDDTTTSVKYIRDPALPAPPFLEDDSQDVCSSSTMQRDAKRFAKSINPLDLLSTVSLQLAPELQSHECSNGPNTTALPTANRKLHIHESHDSKEELQQGCKTYPNGSMYLGHFLNGSRHGFGICHYPNGHAYTGLWCEGKRHGLGKMKYANGNSYEGSWVNDRPKGRGIFYYSDGSADAALWDGTRSVYGVKWDATRQLTWRLVDGVECDMIGRLQALQIGHEVGLQGIPEQL